MKKLLSACILLFTLAGFAQSKLSFDKRFIQAEDQWVALTPDSLGRHLLGFVYIDHDAGPTFDYAGSFTVQPDGRFSFTKKESEGFMKTRLEPSDIRVAIIPESHYPELGISRYPEWLKAYKKDEKSVSHLFRWGFIYNAWNECDKALGFLENAYQREPDYDGLRGELAFSYNCLQQFQKAVEVLTEAVRKKPLDAYLNKELIYAQIHNGDIEKAKKSYWNFLKNGTNKTYNGENAFNILGFYYQKGDAKSFYDWLSKTDLENDPKLGKYVASLKQRLPK